jgi:hypothetical protein
VQHRQVQGFIGIDISQPGNKGLIQQQRF